MLSIITTNAQAQQWQSVVSLDSRVGYSTNTYLNPFLSEWDSTVESGYNVTSAVMQSYWNNNAHNISLTGGVLFESLFSQTANWKGGLGVAGYNYRFSNDISAGVELGGSYFTSRYSRMVTWIQPKVSWFVTPFTLFRVKAGTNFRKYQNYRDQPTSSSRYDFYGLEFETWPNYRWQLTAGLHGSLNNLLSIQKGFNAKSTVNYHFNNGAHIGLNIGLEQYQTELTEQQNGGSGGPPIGGPPDQTMVTSLATDRMFKVGLDGSVPINQRFSVFGAADVLHYKSEASNVSTNDYKLSAGVRYSFTPKLGGSDGKVNPEWKTGGDSQEIRIQYSADGRLYLVGEFNNWSKSGIPLRKQSDNTYIAQIELPPGSYEYKILRKREILKRGLNFRTRHIR
ncbi:MAG: glycogen-binding domain-containing protein [Fodinibius sp.]|nr:glycogen-binding domain-containing protein [Fodinibius sp.]